MKPSEILLGILRIPMDFLMTMAAFLLAYQLRSQTDLIPGIQLPLDLHSFPPINDYLLFAGISSSMLMFIFAFNKLYTLKNTIRINQEIGQIIILTSTWLMIIIAYFFLRREFPFSRLALAYSYLLTLGLVCFGRIIIRALENFLFSKGIGQKRVLIVGDNIMSMQYIKLFKKDKSQKIIGIVDEQKGTLKIKYLGKLTNLENIVSNNRIDSIIQTSANIVESSEIVDFCREHHLEYGFIPDLLNVHQTNIQVETIRGLPIIHLKPTPLDGWGKVIKRIFDIIGAIFGIIILFPIFLITAIAIKLESKGTIIFKYLDDGSRVKRVGLHGKLFNFYKFRSMYPKVHNLRYTALAAQNIRKDTPLVKIKNDPRVTRVGRFIRKTSIDELPQLFNVLIGNMSLVGPRPHLPEEVANYSHHHRFVLTIKPGITGMAQISGRSDLNFEDEVRLDTFYIENWSLWLDIKIIFKTFLTVLTKPHQE